MKFGIAFANAGLFSDGPAAAACARAIEGAGFESVWTVEHVLVPVDYQSVYPYAPSGRMPGGGEVDIRCDFALICVGAVSHESGYSTSNLGEAAMMQLLPLTMGTSRRGSAKPIIGPPMM